MSWTMKSDSILKACVELYSKSILLLEDEGNSKNRKGQDRREVCSLSHQETVLASLQHFV